MTQLFISVLNWVQGFIGNYGWSVIVFVLMIRLCLLPLDIKSRRSMRQMALLNPKLEELKKRYANDQEKLNAKTQELYRKSGVNPLSGCLPMLIQLPILYIMFAAMRRVAAQMQIEIMYNWLCDPNLGIATFDAEGLFTGFKEVSSAEVQSLIESIRNGTAVFPDTQSWLWIKSVFQPDNFSRSLIPTLNELASTYSQNAGSLNLDQNHLSFLTTYLDYTARNNFGASAELAKAIDAAFRAYNGYQSGSVMGLFSITFPTNFASYINGFCVLPILACVTQVLSTKLQPVQNESAGAQQAGTGKFMKWFLPIFSLFICWSSTAAFAIYWVFVNVWSIISSFGINYYLQLRDKNNNSKNDTGAKEALQP